MRWVPMAALPPPPPPPRTEVAPEERRSLEMAHSKNLTRFSSLQKKKRRMKSLDILQE